MTLPSGLRLYPGQFVSALKGNWALFECEYILPGQTELHQGFIQGDGHMWAEESLEDEDGNPVKLPTPTPHQP